VKHHSTPFTKPEDTHGLVPSILAKENLVEEALKVGPRFLLETDYIDDPRRPGAVLGPATVPRKTKAWIANGLLTEDQAQVIHRETPERTYGFQIRPAVEFLAANTSFAELVDCVEDQREAKDCEEEGERSADPPVRKQRQNREYQSEE